MIKLDGFGWRHAGRRAWALRGLDLHIAHGERVLLLGPSGAGKSTLLNALAGLLPADSGEAEGSIAIDAAHASIVFQDPQSQLVMSRAGDEVAFGLENLGWDADQIWPRVATTLDLVGFSHPLDRDTSALSGGEQQRLVLAGALAPGPDLLLLDEPTANLDPAGAAMVRMALRDAVNADTTMVIIEHRIDEILDLVHRVIVLEAGGGVRAQGPPTILAGPLGDELAEAGVWVPGRPMPPRASAVEPGEPLITAERLGVRDLSFPDIRVRRGEAIALTGPNGSGKTTLALALGGLVKPSRGRVSTGNGPPHRWPASTLAQRIGSVFQNPEHQFVTTTVRHELELGGTAPARVDELLERLHLTRLAGANPFTLSGGEARRLSVATALAAMPSLLILDEPTFGQDRRTWRELVDMLADLRDGGHAIVTATHDPQMVSALADRIISLEPA